MKFPLCLFAFAFTSAWAGPFPIDAIPAADPRFHLWAVDAVIERGPSDIAYTGDNPFFPNFGNPASATGPADATTGDEGNPFPVVSLGDGGTATLTFDSPIADVAGPDFAVFENAFNSSFLELAHVEASSDGVNFFRFPSISLTQTTTQIPGYGTLDATNLRNLAGKARGGFGTPFDLSELRTHHPLLDINRVTHIRIVDVVGALSAAHRTVDSTGNPINDPYPTDHEFGGFDLDAVGAFSSVITSYAAWLSSRNLSDVNALPAADPDQDGIPNFVAYLTGDTGLSVIRTPTQTLLRYHRLAYRTDGKIRIESSDTLDDWQPPAESAAGEPTAILPNTPGSVSETGEHLIQVTITETSSSNRRFYRLAAEP